MSYPCPTCHSEITEKHLDVDSCLDHLTSKLEFYRMLYDEFEDRRPEYEQVIIKTVEQLKFLYTNYEDQLCPGMQTLCSVKNI